MNVSVPLAEEASDADLIEAWQRGEESAATELVRRHARAVARFLGAAGAGDDVDDIVQEAFFRAFKKIDSFRGDSSFRSWVIRIASNAFKDAYRRASRRQVLSLDGRDFADESADPHGEVLRSDAERMVAEGIKKLPRMQRDVFLLRAQEGLGYDEIAAALNTSEGAARVNYHHAVKRLKDLLQ
ncbi:MAG: sigma-70 family RNA polymerase sigma factor [Gemmatimonadetes bacterium]|nr:sigma-70 family RNA polymerase sigma factor [Gemmatimonadota bacterium]